LYSALRFCLLVALDSSPRGIPCRHEAMTLDGASAEELRA
jgi:hypothetical protein